MNQSFPEQNPLPYSRRPSGSNPFSPPQPPRKRTLRQWYRARSRNQQAGIGCLLLLSVLFVGILCSTAIEAIGTNDTATTPTPTATSAAAIASSASPTALPTTKPTTQPTPRPTHTKPAVPTPTPKPKCQAVNKNPWCYNFSPGNLIYNPPAAFCDYFNCIASFWNGRGFVNECADQTYSKSGGIQGDCSHHSGELRPLYSH